ncbi:SNF2 family N-terminal domain-containing protein [Halteromyces radiatus]|uniref:SNF2 family N-terminal domain-containing protein n=1 Tax=Halteromyces radiatus TaxID=101107 RepID=UPI00221FF048|nr:SNF2 family N-terminal domain-containing protein [Halteromyces radiatus]KAI8082794.1 SNF2 family N-terminal domain-containing protein [Halteromyces radiatus]
MDDGSRKRSYNDHSTEYNLDEKIAALRSVLGDHVPISHLQQLLSQHKGNLELAANSYFINPIPSTPITNSNPFLSPQRKTKTQSKKPTSSRYYIGDTVVTGWATFSGVNPLRQGSHVIIERNNKIITTTKSNKRNRTQTTQNNIVRFSTDSGSEIGRLPRGVAKFVSKLMDLELCDFEASVVCCNRVLKTGDDILLHMKCYIRESAFGTDHTTLSGLPSSISRQTSFFTNNNQLDDDTELISRERTLALLSLIRTLGLRPSRSAVRHSNIDSNAGDDVYDQITHSIMTASTVTDSKMTTSDDDNDNNDEQKEVTDGQLDTIYEKAQFFDAQITPMKQPDTLTLTLKPYQQRALAWMVTKESVNHDEDQIDVRSMHPLWEEYRFPTDPEFPNGNQSISHFYFNPYNGQLDLKFPETNSQERGGILADEMGLGKTIEMLSLIHTNRFVPGKMSLENDYSSPTTLIICPMALLAQWRDEITRSSAPDSLIVEVYYGGSRPQDFRQRYCSDSAPDVLVTTYGVIMSEMNRPENGGEMTLFNVNFWRIVLDEAHHIKNRLSKTAKACHLLKSRRRWALTGTPIQNKMEDLFSLVRFLKCEPWGNYTFWRTFITLPFEKKDPKALSTVKTVLEPLVLRRTKNMRDGNGNPIVPLPEKQISIEYLDFSDPEKDIYESLFKDSKTKFSHFCAAGTSLRNYASIFQLLSRLRQATCHPYLALRKSTGGKDVLNDDILMDDGGRISIEALIDKYNHSSMENLTNDDGSSTDMDRMDIDAEENDHQKPESYGISVLRNLLEQQRGVSSSTNESIPDECPICFEPVESVIMLPCMHMGCRPCVIEYLQKKENEGRPGDCPICRQGPVHENDLLEITKQEEDTEMASNKLLNIRRAVGGYKSSTKIDALVRHLKQYIREGHRTVVFSQFTGFLDMIQVALKLHHIEYVRFDGTLSQVQREKVLAQFTNKDGRTTEDGKSPMVMLISLRAGGVGLNLTCANRVLMMDPWWNFAVEAQAIDRVHRLGQMDSVVVTRFIMKDSVEEQILDIQNRKHAMMNELYMSKDEQKAQHMQDLQRIFGVGGNR